MKKTIVVGSILAVLLLVLVPSVSAVQGAMENHQKNTNEILGTQGCIYTKLSLIWNVLYMLISHRVVKKVGIESNKPFVNGAIRVVLDQIYIIGMFYLAKAASDEAGNDPLESPWYLPKEFFKMPRNESRLILFGMLLKAIVYAIQVKIVAKVLHLG